MLVALDTNILAYAEGVGDAPRCEQAIRLIEQLPVNLVLLPAAAKIILGDAVVMDIPGGPFDIVLQSTVFTSILDAHFQRRLADKMWELTKVGGVLAKIHHWRLTLAPPISRLVTRFHPSMYKLFNAFPFLRTHVLCWIQKDP